MPNQKKFLDSTGLTYFAEKLNNYPTNEVLGAVINAIDNEIQSQHLSIEEIVELIEDLYPEASSSEVESMAQEILENSSTVKEDMVEEILTENSSSTTPSGSPVSLSGYALLNTPHFTGTPTAPTAAAGTNTAQIATTEFVQTAIAAFEAELEALL